MFITDQPTDYPKIGFIDLKVGPITRGPEDLFPVCRKKLTPTADNSPIGIDENLAVIKSRTKSFYPFIHTQ